MKPLQTDFVICLFGRFLFTHGALESSYELELVETCPCVPDRIGIWNCWFFFKERGSTGVPEEKPFGGRERTKQQTQPRYGMYCTAGFEPGHIGGRRVLSPPRYLCSPWETLNSNHLISRGVRLTNSNHHKTYSFKLAWWYINLFF